MIQVMIAVIRFHFVDKAAISARRATSTPGCVTAPGVVGSIRVNSMGLHQRKSAVAILNFLLGKLGAFGLY
jgi:hypothetical protein